MLMRYCLLLMILFLSQCSISDKVETKFTFIKERKNIPFKNYLGINLFEWNFVDVGNEQELRQSKVKLVNAFGFIRHYLDWERIEIQEGHYTFNPSHHGNWNYDAMYEQCKKDGIEVLVCLKNIPKWLKETYPYDQQDDENIPINYGVERTNTWSYLQQAKAAFQFAARYGANTKINPNLIKVDTLKRWDGDRPNQVKIGLNLVKYIECNNEPDKWWKGKEAAQNAEEYAANLSAFYDGHLGKMGKDVGVKNADTGLKVVLGGLAKPDANYIQRIIDWCRKNRGLKADGSVNLCFDVLNYHYYPNENTEKPKIGIAPELSGIGQAVEKMQQIAPQMEVWMTETGYDVGQTPQSAVAIGKKSVEQSQADWNLRTALLYARLGIDKMAFYMLDDADTQSLLPYHSSGFVKANNQPRISWNYIWQVKHLLGKFYFVQSLDNMPLVDLYQYHQRKIVVLTMPEQQGKTTTYQLPVGNASVGIIYELNPDGEQMQSQKVKPVNRSLEIKVSETPIFIELLP